MSVQGKNEFRSKDTFRSTRKLGAVLTYNKRREIKDGFPLPDQILTPDQLALFFREDSVTCLKCGKECKVMSTHLKKIHGLTTDQYRDCYGIPYRLGLTSGSTKNKMKRTGERLYASLTEEQRTQNRQKAHDKLRNGKMRQAGYTRVQLTNRIKKAKRPPSFDESKLIEMKDYMLSENKNIKETLTHFKGKRAYGKTAFYKFLRNNPDLRNKYFTIKEVNITEN